MRSTIGTSPTKDPAKQGPASAATVVWAERAAKATVKIMTNKNFRWSGWLVVLLGLGLGMAAMFLRSKSRPAREELAAERALAEPPRQYNPTGVIGDAMISSDPETRRIIIITDDETNLQISQVITNLDKPKPQVLIKVVFLEVTYRNSSDIGIEGGFSRKINDTTTGNAANAFGLSSLNSSANSATGTNANILGQAVQSFTPLPPGAGLYQILGQDYQVTLRAIAQAGKSRGIVAPVNPGPQQPAGDHYRGPIGPFDHQRSV